MIHFSDLRLIVIDIPCAGHIFSQKDIPFPNSLANTL